MRRISFVFIMLFIMPLTALVGCGSQSDLSGSWRAVLHSENGDVPFFIEVSADQAGAYTANMRNGEELLPFSSVEVTGNKILFNIEHYDSRIEAELAVSGTEMSGEWSKRYRNEERVTLEFSAIKDVSDRFEPLPEGGTSAIPDISGEWGATFGDRDEPNALGIFKQTGITVTGTFLTTTGDYRFLAGTYEQGALRLSCFDGAHAFLFTAKAGEDGLLRGEFISSGKKVSSWTASKDPFELPDPYTLTKLTNSDKRMRWSFPDTEGNIISDTDAIYKGKPIVVTVFGTWCPNCNDATAFLVELYKEYHERGLQFVGLANEYADDFDKDRVMVEKFKKKYGIEWPILIVGGSDKKKAQEALSDLDQVLSYPTNIFIGRDGLVRKIHTGFTGPGTGEHYKKLQEEFRKTIESMLED